MLHSFVCKIMLEFGCRIVGGRLNILNLFKYNLFLPPKFGQMLTALRFVAIADFFRNQVVFEEYYLPKIKITDLL